MSNPRGILDGIILAAAESVELDRNTVYRIADHIRRSNIGLEAAGMEPLKMPEEMGVVLNALLDRALVASERDDGLWFSLRTGQLNALPWPNPGSLRSRIRRGLKLFVREVRGR